MTSYVIQFFDSEYFVCFAGRTGSVVVTSDTINKAFVFDFYLEAESLIIQRGWKDAEIVKV